MQLWPITGLFAWAIASITSEKPISRLNNSDFASSPFNTSFPVSLSDYISLDSSSLLFSSLVDSVFWDFSFFKGLKGGHFNY